MRADRVRFESGDLLRSRTVSTTVFTAVLDIPPVSPRLLSDWARESSTQLNLEAGDVEPLPFARARSRWPDFKRCVQAVADWTRGIGLTDVLGGGDITLMACRGAKAHHDAVQYGGAAFCNLFVSEDKGLDVLFPATGQRIPLVRGTAFIFDTANVHTVLARGRDVFDPVDFASGLDRLQVFLTWELSLGQADVARILGIRFEDDLPLNGASFPSA